MHSNDNNARGHAMKKLMELMDQMDGEKLGPKKPMAVSIEMQSAEKPEMLDLDKPKMPELGESDLDKPEMLTAQADPKQEMQDAMRKAFNHPEEKPEEPKMPSEESEEDPSIMQKLMEYYQSLKG